MAWYALNLAMSLIVRLEMTNIGLTEFLVSRFLPNLLFLLKVELFRSSSTLPSILTAADSDRLEKCSPNSLCSLGLK